MGDVIESAIYIVDKHVTHTTRIFWLSQALRRIERQVDIFENSLRSASIGRLDVAAFANGHITHALDDIRRFADDNRLSLVSEKISDLQHMPASVAASPYGFQIFVHVPLFDRSSVMNVYQHIPLPMPVSDGTKEVFVIIDSTRDTIAISGDFTTFRVTSSVELNTDCTRLGTFFACPRGNHVKRAPSSLPVHSVDDPAVCLWALFRGLSSYALRTCHKSLVRPGPEAVQVSARTFLTYGSTTGNITCKSSNLATDFKTSAFGTFHLPPGCVADSDLFRLSSSASAYKRNEKLWTQVSILPLNTTDLLEDVNITELHTLLTQSAAIADQVSRISLHEAKEHVRLSRVAAQQSLWPSFSLSSLWPSLSVSSITFALTVGHIAFHVILLCRDRAPYQQGSTIMSIMQRPMQVADHDLVTGNVIPLQPLPVSVPSKRD